MLFLLDFFMNLLPVFKWHKYLYCFVGYLLYHMLHLFNPDCFAALTSLSSYNLNIWIFKNHPQKRVSCYGNLSNLGNVLLIIWEQIGAGSAFLEHLEAKILKFFLLGFNHVGTFAQYMYWSAKKNSGYITVDEMTHNYQSLSFLLCRQYTHPYDLLAGGYLASFLVTNLDIIIIYSTFWLTDFAEVSVRS